MTDLEASVLSILKDFGGESSAFLITNPDSPWGKLGDADTLMAAIKSLKDQGAINYNEADDIVSVA